MQKLREVLNEQIKNAYLHAAQSEMKAYLELTENRKLALPDRLKITQDVYEFTEKHGRIDKNNRLETDSLEAVQKSFRKGFEHYNLQMKLLELLLCVIEKKLNITSSPLSQTCQIRQDLPLLRPDDFLMSRLQTNIYQLIEDESMITLYLDDPRKNKAILILWLILKEGINKSKDIEMLLSPESIGYRIAHHWFVELSDKRYWLSPMAELLLTAYWNDKTPDKNSMMTSVNTLLHEHRLLPETYSLMFIDLRAILKNEFILTVSPVEYSICLSALPTTSLTQASLFRIITGQRVQLLAENSEQHSMTVRQKVAWLSAGSPTAQKLRKKTSLEQEELTTAEQMALVISHTNLLVKTSLKESIQISYQRQDELRKLLENHEMAKVAPWCWLVLSWLYHLLRFGGKFKKRLRLTTVKAYINYIAGPFIHEFSGCDPKKMDSLDWAEKLNIVAERIASSKKAYVLYFTDFLIQTDLVPQLCLSDIDIPSIEHRVNANLITQHEADRIIKACETINSPISKLAKLFFCLGFYSGLRRGEVAGLQFSDFTMNGTDYCNLHVRPNKYRELKSSESSRNLPLDSLWPDRLLIKLTEYLTVTKTKFTQAKSIIFNDASQVNAAFTLLTDLLKIITGEPDIRFHHCRHSFCNWIWVRLNYSATDQLAEFSFCQHDFFSQAHHVKLCERLAIAPVSRKKLWALSSLLGHASPEVTTSSYFHLAEFTQRTKFSAHYPSPLLLRRFWGQGLHFNQQGRVWPIPKLKRHLESIFPKQYEPALNMSDVDDAISRLALNNSKEVRQQIRLRDVWKVIQRLAEGHEANNVARLLQIQPEVVAAIVNADEFIMNSSLRRSKYSLMPLINYQKLNRGNIKTIDSLVNLFEKSEDEGRLPTGFNFKILNEVLFDLVGAKNSLIRTHNKNAALLLLKFMQLMGLTERHVNIKWYFPSESFFQAESIKGYQAHLMFWEETIKTHLFSNKKIEILVPKALSKYVKNSTKFKVTISDDGKYLKYHPPGTISIHLLQTKFDRVRHDSEGNIIYTPQRTKAFITFLRLIGIYTQIQTSTCSKYHG
jgi:integrase